MSVTYEPKADAAYIYVTEIKAGGIATTVPGWRDTEAFNINLDFDTGGRLLGIEVLGASFPTISSSVTSIVSGSLTTC